MSEIEKDFTKTDIRAGRTPAGDQDALPQESSPNLLSYRQKQLSFKFIKIKETQGTREQAWLDRMRVVKLATELAFIRGS